MNSQTKQILTNTTTDTGFLFEVGNAAIGFQKSIEAGVISLGVSGLCFAARAAGEAKKLGVNFSLREKFNNALVNNPISRKLGSLVDKMSNNIGTSLLISGSALVISAGFAASKGVDITNLEAFYNSSREALILGAFGLANGLRGVARDLKENSFGQRALDVAGISLASAGVIMAGGILGSVFNMAVTGVFVGAAATAAYQAVKGLPSKGWVQPDLMFAAGCFGNAVLSAGDLSMVFANTMFGVAFVSLDALKKTQGGGLYEKWSSSTPKLS